MLIGKQLADIGAEDQLDAMSVLDAHQSVARAPELIRDRVHHLDAWEPQRDLIYRPAKLRLHHRLSQQLLDGVQRQRLARGEPRLQPIRMASEPGASGTGSG